MPMPEISPGYRQVFDPPLDPIEEMIRQPGQSPVQSGTPGEGMSAYTDATTYLHLIHPGERPAVHYLRRSSDGEAIEDADGEVVLVMEEGCYVASRQHSPDQRRFIPWEDIESSTIPLSDLRRGHPPT
jgi:hypothetical protein